MILSRYFVSINNIEIKRITRFRCYKYARKETRNTSFAGTETVDRSALKYKLSFMIALCSAAELKAIVTAASAITAEVGFYDGADSVTKDMIINMPEVPQPVYLYGQRGSGVYYTNVIINAEEL